MSSNDGKGVIISELRASLVDRDRLAKSIEEQKEALAETKKATETIVTELKVPSSPPLPRPSCRPGS